MSPRDDCPSHPPLAIVAGLMNLWAAGDFGLGTGVVPNGGSTSPAGGGARSPPMPGAVAAALGLLVA